MNRLTILLLSLTALFVMGCSTGVIEPVPAKELTPEEQALASSWQEISLTNIQNGESFTIASLKKPVLVQSFAIWCPNCLKQQKVLKELQSSTDVSLVGLNVDPNEDDQAVQSYIQKNGFDWNYAIAPKELTNVLVSLFGPGVLTAPLEPIILICETGEPRLLNKGHKDIAELQEEIAAGCA